MATKKIEKLTKNLLEEYKKNKNKKNNEKIKELLNDLTLLCLPSSSTSSTSSCSPAPLPSSSSSSPLTLTPSSSIDLNFHQAMIENNKLKSELLFLKKELNETTTGILMRGQLYKWKDYAITFTSKWGLRYFVLQGRTLSYYGDETDKQPRKTFDLQDCIVLDEGIKGNYHIFSICLESSIDTTRGPESGSLLRLSTDKQQDAIKWINMLTKACHFASEDHLDQKNQVIYFSTLSLFLSIFLFPSFIVPFFTHFAELTPLLLSSHL